MLLYNLSIINIMIVYCCEKHQHCVKSLIIKTLYITLLNKGYKWLTKKEVSLRILLCEIPFQVPRTMSLRYSMTTWNRL